MHQSPMELHKKQRQPPPRRSSSPSSSCFCCNSRLSVSSPDRYQYHHTSNNISSLAHTMVQEKLDQMIREEAMTIWDQRRRRRRRSSTRNNHNRQLIVMVAMEKSSHDPKQDFRESMKEMISVNRIYQPNHLRQLLNCFLSMNSSDFRETILQVFHEVCYDVFLST